MLDIQEKSEIIFQFINGFITDESFEDFFSYNDVGVPLAVMIVNDLVILSDSGVDVIYETWESLCGHLNVDPDYNYEDLDQLLERSVPFEE